MAVRGVSELIAAALLIIMVGLLGYVYMHTVGGVASKMSPKQSVLSILGGSAKLVSQQDGSVLTIELEVVAHTTAPVRITGARVYYVGHELDVSSVEAPDVLYPNTPYQITIVATSPDILYPESTTSVVLTWEAVGSNGYQGSATADIYVPR